jgi:hypothetical protein
MIRVFRKLIKILFFKRKPKKLKLLTNVLQSKINTCMKWNLFIKKNSMQLDLSSPKYLMKNVLIQNFIFTINFYWLKVTLK